MTDQEFLNYYDQACISAGRITAPESRIAVQLALQMLAHVHGLLKQIQEKLSG